MPFGEIGKIFKGRFLTGSALFSIGVESEPLLLFLNSAEVGGKAIQEKVLRAENLAKKFNDKPEVAAMMKKL